MLHISWERPEIPEFDPEIHNPEKVFAFFLFYNPSTIHQP